jgi:hypothetical protein
MTGDAFKKVLPGDTLQIGAATWNAVLDAVRAQRGRLHDVVQESEREIRSSTFALIKNSTGSDLGRFTVVALQEPIIAPSESSPGQTDEFTRRLHFVGQAPAAPEICCRFAVMFEPVGQEGIARGIVAGVTPVRLDVVRENDTFAVAKAGYTNCLQSAPYGTARILWKESGTGEKWALVRLGDGEDVIRFELTTELRCGDAATARVIVAGSPSQLTIQVVDSLRLVAILVGKVAKVGVRGVAKYWADTCSWEVVALGDECSSSPSSESSSESSSPPSSSSSSDSSSPPSSSPSSSPPSSSPSSSPPPSCSYTGTVIVGKGDLTRVGDTVCETRQALVFQNGLLCSVTDLGQVCAYVCCSSSSSSESSPPSSPSSSPPSSPSSSESSSTAPCDCKDQGGGITQTMWMATSYHGTLYWYPQQIACQDLGSGYNRCFPSRPGTPPSYGGQIVYADCQCGCGGCAYGHDGVHWNLLYSLCYHTTPSEEGRICPNCPAPDGPGNEGDIVYPNCSGSSSSSPSSSSSEPSSPPSSSPSPCSCSGCGWNAVYMSQEWIKVSDDCCAPCNPCNAPTHTCLAPGGCYYVTPCGASSEPSSEPSSSPCPCAGVGNCSYVAVHGELYWYIKDNWCSGPGTCCQPPSYAPTYAGQVSGQIPCPSSGGCGGSYCTWIAGYRLVWQPANVCDAPCVCSGPPAYDPVYLGEVYYADCSCQSSSPSSSPPSSPPSSSSSSPAGPCAACGCAYVWVAGSSGCYPEDGRWELAYDDCYPVCGGSCSCNVENLPACAPYLGYVAVLGCHEM